MRGRGGGSWPNAPVGRPAAATGPLPLRARPGSGKLSARAGSAGSGGPEALGCPQQGSRTHPPPLFLPRSHLLAPGCGLGLAWRGGGAECSSAQEPGATRHTGTQVSAAGAQAVGHQARPLPLGPWVGWRETGGVFAGHREEPRCRSLARAGVRGLRRAQRAAAALFKAQRPLPFLWPPCLRLTPLLVRLAVDASSPSGRLAHP